MSAFLCSLGLPSMKGKLWKSKEKRNILKDFNSFFWKKWGKFDKKILWLVINGTVNSILNVSTFISTCYTFALAENKRVYTPSQVTKKAKYFGHVFKKLTLAGKTPFHPFSSSQAASFPSLDQKCTGFICRKWTSKCLFPRRHNRYELKENRINPLVKCYNENRIN